MPCLFCSRLLAQRLQCARGVGCVCTRQPRPAVVDTTFNISVAADVESVNGNVGRWDAELVLRLGMWWGICGDLTTDLFAAAAEAFDDAAAEFDGKGRLRTRIWACDGVSCHCVEIALSPRMSQTCRAGGAILVGCTNTVVLEG